MLRHFPVLACAGLLFAQRPAPADLDPARAFFAAGEVVRISITLTEADREQLRKQPRDYVPAVVHVDREPEWLRVGVKLKGAAGSFREIDDRPGFTLHLGRFGETNRLHGLQRFHLNNCVQDDSQLCEWLGHEVFAAAGLPAPRVAHALVTLDGRSLGLYVLREAFDRQFLLRVFGNTAGNLYDGGFCQDIDSELEKDSGDGNDDRSDLRRLQELCQDATDRATRLGAAIDMAAFLDFMALEAMLGHWDGYTQNRNNFRLWCGSAPARVHFLPHGMDQLFGEEDASVLDHPTAIVASACHEDAGLRKRYRDRLRALLPLFDPQRIGPKLEAIAAKLQRALRPIDGDAARSHATAVRGLLERIAARHRHLQTQVKAPEPKPLQFSGSKPIALKTWHPGGTDHVVLAKKGFHGTAALQIACQAGPEEPREAAWRTNALLGRGRYRLSAAARCEGIREPKPEAGATDGGVQLAVDGKTSERLAGNQDWHPLVCEFEVSEFQRSVELQLRLRAFSGTAWFRADSLQIIRLPD